MLVHDFETEASVEGHILRLIRFQISGRVVLVDSAAERSKERAANSLPLAMTIYRNRAEMPVWNLDVVPLPVAIPGEDAQ